MFDRVLIANRGEIAVRIIRTLRRLGVESVAVYTDPDRDSPHVSKADTAFALGGAGAYLDVDAIMRAARQSGAAAVHPGYGFLAENPALARACDSAEISFIGPPAKAIELMGDKINAKRAVAASGVPVVPGRDEPGLDDAQLAEAATAIGFPVLLKPSAGGGGKGMRLVTAPSDLQASIAAARREAVGAFGDRTLLVERYVLNPRHIEMQIFADQFGSVVALGERECSLQRRHQKIVEEAPSPLLDPKTREAMAAGAVAAARACDYVGAGTVEFIVSSDRPREFFFMEMNTRLQVEHAVTESVLGLDLVELQLRVAAGEPLPWSDSGKVPVANGHAIEARIYAEDPDRGFLPSSGQVLVLEEPVGTDSVRVDSALAPGMTVGTTYDPMLAKVIAWGDTRREALSRLRAALSSTVVLGLATNTGFLVRLLDDPDVVAGVLDTGLVERVAPRLLAEPVPRDVVAAAALLERELDRARAHDQDPWMDLDGWRVGGAAPWRSEWSVGDATIEVSVDDDAVTVGAGPRTVVRARMSGDQLTVELDGSLLAYRWSRQGDEVWIGHGGDAWRLTRRHPAITGAGALGPRGGQVTSPMPGTVLAVHVSEGDVVEGGVRLVTIEAMKMEHAVTAAAPGTVREVLVRPGDPVKLDQTLVAMDFRDHAT